MQKSLLPALVAAVAAAGSFAAVPDAQGSGSKLSGSVLIHADRIEIGDGTQLENGAVLIKDGKVTSVGKDLELPEGGIEIRLDGTLSPGLVALVSRDGALSESSDTTRAMLPEALLADAFDPDHSDFRRARAAGVTSLVLSPRPDSVVSGRSAVVRTFGGEVLTREAHLGLCFSTAGLDRQRAPTSYSSAEAAIADALSGGEGVFGSVAKGEVPVLLHAMTRSQVQRAAAFAKKHGLRGALFGSALFGEVAESIADANLGVVLGPFDIGTSTRTLEAAGALGEAGVPIAFAMDAPLRSPHALRMTAALAMRGGLSRERAMRGLFADAARFAGLAGRVGTIAPGRDADLVLWSGDPLDLSSELKGLWIGGRKVVAESAANGDDR